MAATPKILIVDDEAQIRGFLFLTFETAGYVVRTASSGRDAIALCADECFDVVLSDVMMPEMDGHELVQWIAAHCPETRTALMSGYDASRREGDNTRQCQLISKPFAPGQVLSFVEHVLAGA